MQMSIKPHAKLRFPLMLSFVHDKKCPSLCVPVGMQKIGCPHSDLMLRNCVLCPLRGLKGVCITHEAARIDVALIAEEEEKAHH